MLAAMPKEAQDRQTVTYNLNFVISVLNLNVFPDPPGASYKKKFLFIDNILYSDICEKVKIIAEKALKANPTAPTKKVC